jgi:hypothetical protein
MNEEMKGPIHVVEFDSGFHCNPPAVGAKIGRLGCRKDSTGDFLSLYDEEFFRRLSQSLPEFTHQGLRRTSRPLQQAPDGCVVESKRACESPHRVAGIPRQPPFEFVAETRSQIHAASLSGAANDRQCRGDIKWCQPHLGYA